MKAEHKVLAKLSFEGYSLFVAVYMNLYYCIVNSSFCRKSAGIFNKSQKEKGLVGRNEPPKQNNLHPYSPFLNITTYHSTDIIPITP